MGQSSSGVTECGSGGHTTPSATAGCGELLATASGTALRERDGTTVTCAVRARQIIPSMVTRTPIRVALAHRRRSCGIGAIGVVSRSRAAPTIPWVAGITLPAEMPRRPDFAQHRPDPRLDRYLDRVDRLFRDDEEVGHVLVLTWTYAEQVGGHLWWRRWGPTRDLLWLWTVVDGQFSDDLVPDDATEEELAAYDECRFRHYGETLRVRWTDAEESAHFRSSVFGC
jgi:hypothetical protein